MKETRFDASSTFHSVQSMSNGLQVFPEVGVSERFSVFIERLSASDTLKTWLDDSTFSLVHKLETLPHQNDPEAAGDLRIEPLMRKLVDHTLSRLVMSGPIATLDLECTHSTKWFIQLFRHWIETKWGMTIEDRDDDGGEEEDQRAAGIQHMLNESGVTTLCLDLIAIGIARDLVAECLKLLVALLFKEGGAHEVQTTIHRHLQKGNSEHFFVFISHALESMEDVFKYDYLPEEALPDRVLSPGSACSGEDDEEPGFLDRLPVVKENIIIVRFLQLMCEGHFESNQDILREQIPSTNELESAKSINVLENLIAFLGVLSRVQSKAATVIATSITATILEVVQGPCVKNQTYFALETELIETLNRLMRTESFEGCVQEDEDLVKLTLLEILQGLLEGQKSKDDSVIYERILSVIDIDILLSMIVSSGIKDSPELTPVQTEGLVLLEMFQDYRPDLRKEIKLPKEVMKAMSKEVTSVEIVWNNSLQRRFFHIPDICTELSEASKFYVQQNLDRTSQEVQLMDFVAKARDVQVELKHQEWLGDCKLPFKKNLAIIFSRSNQQWATWVAFWIAVVTNTVMFLTFKIPRDWEFDDGNWKKHDGLGYIDENIYKQFADQGTLTIIKVLNYMNVACSIFTLILFMVVRCPVNYTLTHKKTGSRVRAYFKAVFDPLTMYYLVYSMFVMMAQELNPLWNTLLLLDIIMKNPTTQDVLRSVIVPAKQLCMAVVLMIFVTYIYAFFIFLQFNDDFDGGDFEGMCENMQSCFWTTMNYGMRSSGGIGDTMFKTIKFDNDGYSRSYLDFFYFVTNVVILLNIVFGIIIDTFSDLRTKKLELAEMITGKCFICGIDKLQFDKADDTPGGFKRHVASRDGAHNMWDYLYFMIFIWEQDKDEDDGLELYVRQRIEHDDIQWLPVGKAIDIRKGNRKGDDEQTKFDNLEQTLSEEFKSSISSLKYLISENKRDMMKKIDQLAKTSSAIQTISKKSYDMHWDEKRETNESPDPHFEPIKSPSAPLSVTQTGDQNVAAAKRGGRVLTVQVQDARHLVQPHLLGHTDPFVTVFVFWNGSKVGQAETIWFGSENPSWKNEELNTFRIPLSAEEDVGTGSLVFEVQHMVKRGTGHFLGCIQIPSNELQSSAVDGMDYPLTCKQHLPKGKQTMVQGFLRVMFRVDEKGGGGDITDIHV